MNNLDDDIRKVLAEGDVPYNFDMEEGLMAQMASLFRGKLRWMSVFVVIESIVFLVLIVLAVLKFNQADDVKSLIFYATGVLMLMLMLLLVKLWSWMQMNRYCIQREIKRLELRVLELGERKSI